MGKANYTVEQIIIKLREVELSCGQGKTIAEAVRRAGVSEQTSLSLSSCDHSQTSSAR